MAESDNFVGKSKEDIKQAFLQAQEAETKAQETAIEEVIEETETVEEQEETKPELILGKFKTTDDLVKSYQALEAELTKKSQKVKEVESKAADKPDPLYDFLFNQQAQEKDNQEVDKTALEKRVEQAEKVLYYQELKREEEQGRKSVSKKYKDNEILPFNEDTEKELEEKIFSANPQMRYSKDGWELAYNLLKSYKAEQFIQEYKKTGKMSTKEDSRKQSIVEKPTNQKAAPGKRDPSRLKSDELRELLKKQFGEVDRD